jgi:hypothetical protein
MTDDPCPQTSSAIFRGSASIFNARQRSERYCVDIQNLPNAVCNFQGVMMKFEWTEKVRIVCFELPVCALAKSHPVTTESLR